MKKIVIKLFASVLLVAVMISMSSCAFLDLESMMNPSGDADEYMTRFEVERMLEGIEKNITVEGGDTTVIENINSNYSKNILAASKGLLSAVSIRSVFRVTYAYQGGTKTDEKSSFGSGVIYDLDKDNGDAYIITNHHVVYNSAANTSDKISDDITVYLYGQEYSDYAIRAEYIGGSVNYDIAVLRVEGSETLIKSNATEAVFANSDDVCVLDTAIAIGNPEAEGISATVGTVNVDSEVINITKSTGNGTAEIRVMRTDAAVNSGNSGGGLFNDDGKVIGIVNAKMSSTSVDNIGYAIPSNVAKNVADNIIYYDSLDSSSESVKRVFLDIKVTISEAYTECDVETGRIHKRERVIISDISSKSVAYGKLKVNDVINSITIDGNTYVITRTFNVVDAMLTARKSASFVSDIKFNVSRGGKKLDVEVDISGVTLQNY